jgi:type IV secretion system protein VirB11
MNVTALETYLSPLKDIFDQDGVSEVSLNEPGSVWVECRGDIRQVAVPDFTFSHLLALGRLIAQSTEQVISEDKPLLSATLPNGYRVQFMFPPACEIGKVVFSIRKPSSLKMNLDMYEASGAFRSTVVRQGENEDDAKLRKLLDSGSIKEFISLSVQLKKNIVVSGGTSTGKTTFFNAVIREIPTTERVITCEDARELELDHLPNHVHLIASKGGQGRAKVTMQDLIEACLRLRPDRIMLGELRGAEAFSYLRAINTGHPGSIASLHADTPAMAYEQLILMILQAGLGITKDQIRDYVENVVNVVIQLKRAENGRRFISEIMFKEGSI